jgi:hypothetical protein
MAIKKATTTDDLTASAVDPTPTHEERVEQVVEVTDPSMVAKVDAPKTVKVKSPAGTITEVPESIVEALVDSGYSKTK